MKSEETTESGAIAETHRAPHPDKGARRSKSRLPAWAAWAVAAGAVVIVGFAAWQTHPGKGADSSFPRVEAEFFPVQELDRRLAAAEARLKADPTDIGALNEDGMLLFQKGPDRYPDAINELEEALRLGVLDARIFYYLGAMYQQEGLYSFSEAQYEKFLRNYPGDVDARLLLAKLQFQNNRFADSAAQYRQMLANRPNDPLVLENLGLSLWKLNQRDEASRIFAQLAGQNAPPGLRANFYLGQMAFEDKDYKQALRRYAVILPAADAPALALDPAVVHAALAANFEQLKLFREAGDHWQKVLQRNPRDAKAKTGLRTATAALRSQERAAARARRKSRNKK